MRLFFKGAQSRLNGLKSLAKLFNFVVCNPCQSSPFLTILVSLWFNIISLMFFHLCKVPFSGFLQFNGNFVDAQITQNTRRIVAVRANLATRLGSSRSANFFRGKCTLPEVHFRYPFSQHDFRCDGRDSR